MFLARLRVTLLAALLALSGVFGSAAPVLASETWCDVDPPVLIKTPEGNLRVVYVVSSGPVVYLPQLLVPRIDYEVRSVSGGGATAVRLDVTVARGLLGERYDVKSEVWSGPARTGELLSVENGTAGEPMRHRFRLNVG
ncbi:MAG TPA: hypothetical protein VFN74_10375 [Chloroflexota bacterium]|nr:hypothetical protein [Chloroflexota bacterium]